MLLAPDVQSNHTRARQGYTHKFSFRISFSDNLHVSYISIVFWNDFLNITLHVFIRVCVCVRLREFNGKCFGELFSWKPHVIYVTEWFGNSFCKNFRLECSLWWSHVSVLQYSSLSPKKSGDTHTAIVSHRVPSIGSRSGKNLGESCGCPWNPRRTLCKTPAENAEPKNFSDKLVVAVLVVAVPVVAVLVVAVLVVAELVVVALP